MPVTLSRKDVSEASFLRVLKSRAWWHLGDEGGRVEFDGDHNNGEEADK